MSYKSRVITLAATLSAALLVAMPTQALVGSECTVYHAGIAKIPEGDWPSKAEKKYFSKLDVSDCIDYKASPDETRDLAKYRKCLLSHHAADHANLKDLTSDDSSDVHDKLAEIYANGWGVERNPELAIALVCNGGSVYGVLDKIYTTKDQPKLKSEIIFCKYVSGIMEAKVCAYESGRQEELLKESKISRITKSWTPRQKKAFKLLRNAQNDYNEKHMRIEAEHSHSGFTIDLIANEAMSLTNFLQNITELEAGRLPSVQNFAQLYLGMSELYARILQSDISEHHAYYQSPSKDEIKSAQESWKKYQDAWVAFGKSKYPNVQAETWKIWPIKERIRDLSKLELIPDGYYEDGYVGKDLDYFNVINRIPVAKNILQLANDE